MSSVLASMQDPAAFGTKSEFANQYQTSAAAENHMPPVGGFQGFDTQWPGGQVGDQGTAFYTGSAPFQAPPPQRRSLTKPDTGAGNNGWDNENSDLIICVDDELVSADATRYIVRGLLGQGTFGQVVECTQLGLNASSDTVAVKVIKNQSAYFQQARVEVGVLQLLNQRADAGDGHHIVRMLDFFVFRAHLCLVFELLSVNLYELIKHNQFRGLSMNLLRLFMTQILDALAVLQNECIIHCDLKPENVLLKGADTGDIKVIDFGSACLENQTVYSYIQSRFYRSPEVVLGYQYSMAIDMWSLGCVAAELFLGLPLFPGASEHDLLSRIVEMMGPPPASLLGASKNTDKYFRRVEIDVQGPLGPTRQVGYQLRTREEFETATGSKAPAGKRYFKHHRLADIIGAYPLRDGLSDAEVAQERGLREALVDFLLGVLDLDPGTRWTPRQALQHPFITGGLFQGPFQPLPDPRPTMTRRASLSTASLAVPVAGAASYSNTPSWSQLLGPASMSGRQQMLALSPEQAHMQAHAAAMAAMAQGFSPHESVAAAYNGVYGSHPLLQQMQQGNLPAPQLGTSIYGGYSGAGGASPCQSGPLTDATSPQLTAYAPRNSSSPLAAASLGGVSGRGSMDVSSPSRRPSVSRLSSGQLQQMAAHQIRGQYAQLNPAQVPAQRAGSMDRGTLGWPGDRQASGGLAPARRSNSLSVFNTSGSGPGGPFSTQQQQLLAQQLLARQLDCNMFGGQPATTSAAAVSALYQQQAAQQQQPSGMNAFSQSLPSDQYGGAAQQQQASMARAGSGGYEHASPGDVLSNFGGNAYMETLLGAQQAAANPQAAAPRQYSGEMPDPADWDPQFRCDKVPRLRTFLHAVSGSSWEAVARTRSALQPLQSLSAMTRPNPMTPARPVPTVVSHIPRSDEQLLAGEASRRASLEAVVSSGLRSHSSGFSSLGGSGHYTRSMLGRVPEDGGHEQQWASGTEQQHMAFLDFGPAVPDQSFGAAGLNRAAFRAGHARHPSSYSGGLDPMQEGGSGDIGGVLQHQQLLQQQQQAAAQQLDPQQQQLLLQQQAAAAQQMNPQQQQAILAAMQQQAQQAQGEAAWPGQQLHPSPGDFGPS